MKFQPTQLPGVFLVQPQPRRDARGSFTRAWCRREFAEHGLNAEFVQCSQSFNARRATIRGLHFQAAPLEEAKLVRCTRGRIFDVAVDLRRDSPTRGQWVACELSAEDGRMLYVPEGCAHGYQTLEEGTELLYHITAYHAPDLARGVRWDDPALRIAWPLPNPVLSAKDRALPTLAEVVAARSPQAPARPALRPSGARTAPTAVARTRQA